MKVDIQDCADCCESVLYSPVRTAAEIQDCYNSDKLSGKGNCVAVRSDGTTALPVVPGEQWVLIGRVNGESTPTTVFAGTFDGGGRRITGMSITCMDDAYPAYSGVELFDSVSGTMENLTVAEFQINATLDRAGGIAGILAAGGTIRRCTADGAIAGTL